MGRLRKEFDLFPPERRKTIPHTTTRTLASSLACGCTGDHECLEAQRLWAEVNRQYEPAKAVVLKSDEPYQRALAAYRSHKKQI